MEYSLSVSYGNVESISATVKVKAYDEGNKALSGASPIADSDSTVPSILQHLTDFGGRVFNVKLRETENQSHSGFNGCIDSWLLVEFRFNPFR